MKNKNILYFFAGVLTTIVVEGVAILIMLYDPSPGYIEVNQNDWNDDWEKNENIKDSSRIEFYSDRTGVNKYIIKNFANTPNMSKIILSTIDTSKFSDDNQQLVWIFLWNDYYNHRWRVENINQEYVNNVSTLFRISLSSSPKYKYLIKKIDLFPSLQKKHKEPSNIEIDEKIAKTTYLTTDYKNGFDFFLWKDLQDYTKLLSKKNDHRGRYVLLNDSNKKELVTIEWFGDGYKIKLPKVVNKLKKQP